MCMQKYKVCENCLYGKQIKEKCIQNNESSADAAMDTLFEYDKCLESCHISGY